jgi:geranylgeranyl diphosphate synthase type II
VVDTLAGFLNVARAEVDDALNRYLPAPPTCPEIVSEAMRYSVFAGGKRLRPILALAAADAVDRSPEGLGHTDATPGFTPAMELALPAACAIEMIHTYSLIHDDLPAMDNDTLRRGQPTLHVKFGDGIAILAGDGLHAEAFALLAREPIETDADIAGRKLHVIRLVAEAAGAAGMVGGQTIDLQAAGQAGPRTIVLDRDGLRAMHARKTGALIRAAAVSGAIMAGAPDGLVAAVDRYATDLGLAFQIVDDILDVEGSAEQLGKTTGKDAAGAKPTYPAMFGLEESHRLASECAIRARQTLRDARLTAGHLGAIADWVVSRRN